MLDLQGEHASLSDRFVVPPFSVLDTRQGYWQARRREWLSLGIRGELGRGEGANNFSSSSLAASGGWDDHPSVNQGPARTFAQDLMRREHVVGTSRRDQDAASNLNDYGKKPEWATGTGTENMAPGTSIFDPVLCELAYRWFAPEGGTVLDPFAGGSVRGIVASRLGHPYIGIDLSAIQTAENARQAALICEGDYPAPSWRTGDSRAVLAAQGIPAADLIFSCPPYGDLEVYSDHPADLSGMTWPDFVEAYSAIIRLACDRLTTGRFAVFVVSEIRSPKGEYRGLVPVTIEAFLAAGLRFYNDLVLLNPVGSLAIRVAKQFEASRKVGRMHQNILVFAKGTPERGWSYDRADPPKPQLSLFDDVA